MLPNPWIAMVTVAAGGLTSLGAVVWQVVHGHDVDPLLAGLAGTLMAGLLPSPLAASSRPHGGRAGN
jgi:hypothetical protein